MTLIQPHREDRLFKIFLTVVLIVLFTGVVWLVLIYNQVVNVQHSVAAMQQRVQKLQAESGKNKEQLFAYLDGQNVENFVAAYSLVKENNPRYVRGDDSTLWAFALQQ